MSSFNQVQQDRRRSRRDFRDWKKHHVRARGWLPAFQECRDEYGDIRYLTLCAKEAIDVRYFAQKGLLSRNREQNEYPFVTFVESDAEDYAFLAESLGKVRLAVHATLEDALLNQGNPFYQDLAGSFPYHIVNLDFCGQIVPPRDHPYSETMRAIERVVELQSQSDLDHWYLFLTFSAQEQHANQEANGQLEDIVSGNLAREDFRASYGRRPAPGELRQRMYPEFLRLGVGKFLADRARHRGLTVDVQSSWLYSRADGEYYIVKLVLKFRRIQDQNALPDPHRAAQAYEAAVHNVFRSRPTNVDGLGRAERQQADQDLSGVVAELERSGIIT